MKKNGLIILSLSLIIFATACTKVTSPPAPVSPTPIEPAPVQTPAVEPVPEPEPTPASHYENVAEGVSPLTGLPYEGEGKAIMVQIENTVAARPQSGISKADLIYEMEVESTITRLTTFFLSEYPTKVGPVRSARKQHMYLWSEWNYLYTFYGGSKYKPGQNIYDFIKELDIKASSLDGTSTSKSFTRSTDRKAPHNAYTNLAYSIENAYDYVPKQRTLYFDEEAAVEGTSAEDISFSYRSDNNIKYEFQNTTGFYQRFINDKPMIDKETNEQVKVKNIIIQHANHYKVEGTVYTNIDLVGSGVTEYFSEGMMRTGTWERKNVDSLTVYYDADGKEIALKPGKTYIQIARSEMKINVE